MVISPKTTPPERNVIVIDAPASTPPLTPGRVTRRTLIAGAAWSVPTVLAVATAPAAAASVTTALSLSSPGMQVAAAGATPLTARYTDASGQSVAGKPVSFSGPIGTSFSPSIATTNGSGVATTTLTTTDSGTTPGSSVVVTATVAGMPAATASLSVLGANGFGVGRNDQGALGTGSTDGFATLPAQLSLVFPSPLRAISAGANFTLALLDDGTVWSIGANTLGQLGDGTTTSRSTWAKITPLSGVTRIAAATANGYALLSDGTVRSWGANGNGQLGNGTLTASPTPVAVSALSSATQIATADRSAYALASDGTVRAWGYNGSGQLGNGTTIDSPTPVTVTGLTRATQIAAGFDSAYALVDDSTVRAWGGNDVGQLGNNAAPTPSSTPVSVSFLSQATQISAGRSSAYAVVNGQVNVWGSNASGQLGDGTTINRAFPTAVAGISDATQVVGASSSAYAVTGTGVRAWGSNDSGQLGTGSTTASARATSVQNVAGITVLGSGPSANAAFFLRRQPTLTVTTPNMQVVAWGGTVITATLLDGLGQPFTSQNVTFTGPYGTRFASSPVLTDRQGIATTTFFTTDAWAVPGSTISVTASVAGVTSTVALTVLGANASSAGSNSDASAPGVATGSLGTGSTATYVATTAQLSYVFATPIRSVVSSNSGFSAALLEDGTVWTIGSNTFGQLGNGTTSARSTWAKVPGLSGVAQIAAGYFSLYARLTDGTVRAWGANTAGQLGTGSGVTGSAVPVVVPGVTRAVHLAAGYATVCVATSDGTVLAWGENTSGQLGNGTTGANSSTPVSVSGLTGATQVAVGRSSAYALAGGRIYSWGSNANGRLGNGTTADTNTPVAVSGITSASLISSGFHAAYALVSGKVYAWGNNANGQLGTQASVGDNPAPAPVPGISDAIQVTAIATTAYALVASGTRVLGWGANDLGQLGNGTTSASSTPTEIPALGMVSSIVSSTAAKSIFYIRG